MVARSESRGRVADEDRLRAVVVFGDALALTLAAFGAFTATGALAERAAEALPAVAFAVGAGLWAMRAQGLWVRRVCAMRVIEIARLSRASALLGGGLLIGDRLAAVSVGTYEIVAIVSTGWLLLVGWRSAVRIWLRNEHRHGRQLRRTVVIGTDSRAVDLIDALEHDPDGASIVVGVIGPEPRQMLTRQDGSAVPWLGAAALTATFDALDPDLVVLCKHFDRAKIDRIVAEQHAAGRAVMIDPNLGGFNLRSLAVLPVAYEPLLHVEKVRLSRLSMAVKRVFDAILSAALILVASPLLVAVAVLIKLADGGPVLFKQLRVGRNGRLFPIYKFRTMVVDAEQRLHGLEEDNLRGGPLFKLNHDPRVTKTGRFLRDSSLDELPQLFNVVLGHMSLVGPRPALPTEVERFPADLRRRTDVRPGITGLWQVEARDSSYFDLYRRLDLYYVRNWSMSLDLVILLATIEQVAARLIRLRSGGGEVMSADPAVKGAGAVIPTIAARLPVEFVHQRPYHG